MNYNYPLPIGAIQAVVQCYWQDEYEDWLDCWKEVDSQADPLVVGMTFHSLEELDQLRGWLLRNEPQRYNTYCLDNVRDPGPEPDYTTPTVEEFLRKRVAQLDPTPIPGLKYNSIEQYALQHGQHFPAPNAPCGFPKLPWLKCFPNAKLLAIRRGLTYVEGFALLKGCKFPELHAWNLDESGRVIDATWQDQGLDYFGIPMELSLLEMVSVWSVLDDAPRRWPLLQ